MISDHFKLVPLFMACKMMHDTDINRLQCCIQTSNFSITLSFYVRCQNFSYFLRFTNQIKSFDHTKKSL